MGALIPPRLSRLTKYALRSLPSATTRCEGVASGTSTSNGPELPKIRVHVIEGLPVFRHPIIAGRATKDWAGLKANHRFPTFPIWGTEGVTSDNKRVLPVASDAADSPNGTAVCFGGRSPGRHIGRIVYRHAYEPAMKRTAIPHTSIANIKNAYPRYRVPVVAFESMNQSVCRCMWLSPQRPQASPG